MTGPPIEPPTELPTEPPTSEETTMWSLFSIFQVWHKKNSKRVILAFFSWVNYSFSDFGATLEFITGLVIGEG